MRFIILSLAVLLSANLIAEDKIYTWVDESGITQFGDRPPIDSVSEEVVVRGFEAKPLIIPLEQLEGNWRVISQSGQIQDWTVRKDGRIQIDIRLGANRTVINGVWQLSDAIFTVNSELIQEIKAGQATVNDAPVQFTYKFLEFEEKRFRVFNNGGTLVGTK